MQPRIKNGLVVGGVGLVLNICASFMLGCLGLLVAMTAGAVAGFAAVRQEHPPAQNEGARAGVVAGLIAGALVSAGQIIGGILSLIFLQATDTLLPFVGVSPSQFSTGAEQVGYYLGGLGTGLCLGLIGTGMAALAGALAGYLGTPPQNDVAPAG